MKVEDWRSIVVEINLSLTRFANVNSRIFLDNAKRDIFRQVKRTEETLEEVGFSYAMPINIRDII